MIEDSGRSLTPRLIEEVELIGRQQVHETLTDKMGSFPNGGTNGQGNSAAERLQLANEHELRSCRKVADRIVELVETHQPARWGFAAPSEINRTILDELPPAIRERLHRNLPLDLTKVPAKEILERFQADER
jgi:hypothetical protein